MEERSERYKRRIRRRRLPYIAVSAAAVLVLLAVVVLVSLLDKREDKGGTKTADNSGSKVESQESKDSETGKEETPEKTESDKTESDSAPEDLTLNPPESDSQEEPGKEDTEPPETAEPDTPAESTPEQDTPEESTPEPVPPGPTDIANADYSRVAFVGDSRTLAMASGGTYEYKLVPDDYVFATWGGRIVESSAHKDAMDAALTHREKAVFWFGINDVQINYDRDDANKFAEEYYTSVLNTYISTYGGTSVPQIYIVSILNTGAAEKDHYDGQEANIEKYNAALQKLCGEKGYTYLDATPLLVGEEGLLEDHIHFSKEWYEQKYLPFIISALGI